MDGTVLVADDDRTIRTVLTQALTRAGCRVHATSSLTTLMRWVEEGRGNAVVSDVMMPDGNGIEMLPAIHAIRPDLPVIVISAQNTIMTTIKATEANAFDYLPKPFDLPDLLKKVSAALSQNSLVSAPQSQSQSETDLPLIGTSDRMQDIYKMIARVMNTDIPILIHGESGTGKSLIANVIHSFSNRNDDALFHMDQDQLQHIDLTQFTTGTVIVEDVNRLNDDAQMNLCRMIDETMGRLRFIAICANPNPTADGLSGELFYRLNGAVLDLPPLRDRIEDIEPLCAYFLEQETFAQGPVQLEEAALGALRMYSWPGNVRQLHHILLRLALNAKGNEIMALDVQTALKQQPTATSQNAYVMDHDKLSDAVARHLQRYFDLHGDSLPPNGVYERILHEIERPLIEIALDATGGNQAKCADLLGINRNTLRKKMTGLDIRVTRRRKLM